MHKVFIKTFGCQMNEYDSGRMAGVLAATKNYLLTENEDEAEFIIVNTCSVREHAENREYSYIGRHIKDKKIIVAGCMAQNLKAEIIQSFPKVFAVVGTFNFANIDSIISKHKKQKLFVDEALESYTAEPLQSDKYRAYVTIMQGCNNFCSYCIVPYVRGRERSRTEKSILHELKAAADKGYKEVMLLGQNVNSYGLDNGCSFTKLLKDVEKIDGIERIRFMTSHPKDLNDALIETVAASSKICNHFHLPAQAGSDKILKAMNRKYTRDEYLKKVFKIRKCIPDVSVTTDILVGFPGETKEDFKDTVSLMKEAGFDNSYVFKYSKRSGTKSAELAETVPEKEKGERVNYILDLQKKISENINKSYVGKTVEVFFNRENEKFVEGETTNFKHVKIAAQKKIEGMILPVKITSARSLTLSGEIEKK